jgi:hypothetical protein
VLSSAATRLRSATSDLSSCAARSVSRSSSSRASANSAARADACASAAGARRVQRLELGAQRRLDAGGGRDGGGVLVAERRAARAQLLDGGRQLGAALGLGGERRGEARVLGALRRHVARRRLERRLELGDARALLDGALLQAVGAARRQLVVLLARAVLDLVAAHGGVALGLGGRERLGELRRLGGAGVDGGVALGDRLLERGDELLLGLDRLLEQRDVRVALGQVVLERLDAHAGLDLRARQLLVGGLERRDRAGALVGQLRGDAQALLKLGAALLRRRERGAQLRGGVALLRQLGARRVGGGGVRGALGAHLHELLLQLRNGGAVRRHLRVELGGGGAELLALALERARQRGVGVGEVDDLCRLLLRELVQLGAAALLVAELHHRLLQLVRGVGKVGLLLAELAAQLLDVGALLLADRAQLANRGVVGGALRNALGVLALPVGDELLLGGETRLEVGDVGALVAQRRLELGNLGGVLRQLGARRRQRAEVRVDLGLFRLDFGLEFLALRHCRRQLVDVLVELILDLVAAALALFEFAGQRIALGLRLGAIAHHLQQKKKQHKKVKKSSEKADLLMLAHVVAERLLLALELLNAHVADRLLGKQLLLGGQQTIQFTLQSLQFLLKFSASLYTEKKKKFKKNSR